MAGANGGADPGARPEWRWDVALSFAGAQRGYVSRVAAALKARGVRCFYDADEQVRLWGTHLAEVLPRIYARESAAVVVFVSADYAAGDWTRLERRAALARAVAEAGIYVLPARFDDSDLPGLLPDVVSVDLRRYTPEQFADLVAAKLADLATSPQGGRAQPRYPLLADREAIHEHVRARGVADWNPIDLGVHRAIDAGLGVAGHRLPLLPPYIVRAHDLKLRRLLKESTAGRVVVLVGESCTGKTRAGYEALQETLPDWQLLRPGSANELTALVNSLGSGIPTII